MAKGPVAKKVGVERDPNLEVTKVSRIKLDDPKKSKRHAVFVNEKKEKYKKYKMDGGVVKNTTSADWMLAREKVGNVVVELKGGGCSSCDSTGVCDGSICKG